MQPIYIGLAAFCGGLLSALLGWFDSKENFDWRKFGKSLVMAFISGISFAVAYNYSGEIGTLDIFAGILGGAGVDALSNRVIGTFTK